MDVRELAKRAWYLGARYKCVICGARTRIRKRLSLGSPVRCEDLAVAREYIEHADCPVCYANRQSRLVFKFLTNLHLKSGAFVLHVAPEVTLYRNYFRSAKVQYRPIDLVPERYREIPNVKKIGIAAVPYPNNTFDLIICNNVLNYVPDGRSAMKELRRIIKPDGIAILQVPIGTMAETAAAPQIKDIERQRRLGQSSHVRLYSEYSYLEQLRGAGFVADSIPAHQIASYDEIDKYQLNPRERLFVARPAHILDLSWPQLSPLYIGRDRVTGVKRPQTA